MYIYSIIFFFSAKKAIKKCLFTKNLFQKFFYIFNIERQRLKAKSDFCRSPVQLYKWVQPNQTKPNQTKPDAAKKML